MSTNSDQLLESLNELELQLRTGKSAPWIGIETPAADTKRERYVSVGYSGEDMLSTLVEPDWSYWRWLRLAILRLLTHAYLVQGNESALALHCVARQIGIENAREALEGQGLSGFVQSLKAIEQAWSADINQLIEFPARLNRNLDLISAELGMNATERHVFGLAVLIHAEPILEATFDLYGSVRGPHVPRLFAIALQANVKEVERSLVPDGLLAQSGMLSVDLRCSGNVSSRLDLISLSFANRMVQEQADIFSLLLGLVERPEDTQLSWHDYEHMQEQLVGLENHLRHALQVRMRGVNVLFYGQPGTGKTQLSRLLAKSLGTSVVSVSSTDQSQFPISAATRTKMFRLAQSTFGNSQTLLVLDECEEIFSASHLQLLETSTSPASKSWFNHALESNRVPTIWICNSIQDFDPAYVRRFDYCIRFDIPATKYRRKHLQAKFGNYWTDSMVQRMAKHVGASQAIITRTAEIISQAGQSEDAEYKGKLALQLLNQKFKALGYAEAQPSLTDESEFQPDYVNVDIDLKEIAKQVGKMHQGRICVYGPPGTGKTAFGHWLAEILGLPHLAYRASDLLAPHVGETEKLIAKAFAHARTEGGVLQFDEVDTFLAERQSSRQGWEVSMVNELLVQMESFAGIFIASTNLYDRLDEASLRRFDLVLKFDFLRPEHAQKLFVDLCERLHLDGPMEAALERVGGCKALTPGDFHQQYRQAKFSPPNTSLDLVRRLVDTNARKQGYRKASMGFLVTQ